MLLTLRTDHQGDTAARLVYTSLFYGEALKPSHIKGPGLLPGKTGLTTIFVDTSTLYPATSSELEKECFEGAHRVFLSCPVFGPPPLAESGQLLIVLSGDPSAKPHIAHLLVPACGRKALDLGSNVEKAGAFKLIGNSLVIGVIELLAESM